MTDPQLIDAAYEDLAKSIAANFLNAYMLAGTEQDRTNAKNHFINGFNAARQAKTVAHQILPN